MTHIAHPVLMVVLGLVVLLAVVIALAHVVNALLAPRETHVARHGYYRTNCGLVADQVELSEHPTCLTCIDKDLRSDYSRGADL